MSHTPGPWMPISDPPKTKHNRMTMITTSYQHGRAIDCTGSGSDYEEDCANARLIAAAPDLLDALKDAHDQLALFLEDFDGNPRSPLIEMRAAIAKAEGK